MNPTIEDRVQITGVDVADEELVNFGRIARKFVDPSTGRRSYWFRFGDIKHLTLLQLQIAGIGQLASAGQAGGANVMRVSSLDSFHFTLRPATNFVAIGEYSIDVAVPIRLSVPVGP